MSPNAVYNTEYGLIILSMNDKGVGNDIRSTGYFERDQINILKGFAQKLLEKKDHIVFYDVGANIGTHTLAMAQTFGKSISIRSFEAQRQVYYMLCGTIALNGLRNVTCHNLAISGYSGLMDINLPDYDSYQNFGGFELLPIEKSDNGDMVKNHWESVKVEPLDLFNEPVDIIKMDIEGCEEDALKGSLDMITKYKPVCMIEQHKSNSNNIIKFFVDLGYTVPTQQHDLLCFPPGFSI